MKSEYIGFDHKGRMYKLIAICENIEGKVTLSYFK